MATVIDLIRSLFAGKETNSKAESEKLFDRIKLVCNSLMTGYNSQVAHEPLQITIREGGLEKAESSATPVAVPPMQRLVISNAFWAISLRMREGKVEFFLIPTSDLSFLQKAETATRLKLRLQWGETSDGGGWLMDDMPVEPGEIDTLIATLFKDMCTRSQSEFEVIPESVRYQTPNGMSLTGSIRALVTDKKRLVQAVVNQQEEVQKRIAWDIHDAVIGDVLGLKRSLGGDRPVPSEEILSVLDRVTKTLRQICHDLTPRDLPDLGLTRVLEDLVTHLGERSGMDCIFSCEDELSPELPEEVQIHIYRIVQEALHNIHKHAQASRVIVAISEEGKRLTIKITDNGKGFDLGSSRDPNADEYSGNGFSIARERTELISQFYPANLLWDSTPGAGTTVTLQIMFEAPAAAPNA